MHENSLIVILLYKRQVCLYVVSSSKISLNYPSDHNTGYFSHYVMQAYKRYVFRMVYENYILLGF